MSFTILSTEIKTSGHVVEGKELLPNSKSRLQNRSLEESLEVLIQNHCKATMKDSVLQSNVFFSYYANILDL